MELTEPQLAAPHTEEKTWDAEGIPVLKVSVALPRLDGSDRRTQRINRYSVRFEKVYLAYCRQILLPEAAESCRAAMETSAPWSMARAELNGCVSFLSGALLSLVYDARESVHGLAGFQFRRSMVWDLSSGLPVPISEFFPPHTRCRSILLRFAREQIPRRIENGELWRTDWRMQLRRTLSLQNYYLSEGGLCFFFPLGSLAPHRAGIPSFTIPYDAEKGPFAPTPARDTGTGRTPLEQLKRLLQ